MPPRATDGTRPDSARQFVRPWRQGCDERAEGARRAEWRRGSGARAGATLMMSASRIDQAFARLHDEHRAGMVTYVTAGDPDAATSAQILIALAHAGAD